MDFTIKTYHKLLLSVLKSGYATQTVQGYLENPSDKVVVLRHDVDERPANALKMAIIEAELGVRATYYFRIVKISNKPGIIKKIAELGHEIGYHYEDLSLCKGDIEKAIAQFATNLAYFRSYYPVKTVCMHGSSMSGIDNRDIWKHISLKEFGLIGEPYLSIDYSKVLYLTDTARCWDGYRYSIRDYVSNHFANTYHSTYDIIKSFAKEEMPDKVLLQSHTLWTDSMLEWYWLELRERLRNRLKIFIVKLPFLKTISYWIIKSYSK